ncbi:MAG: hypothetical protein EXS35_04925 [Pedosphaera sp.]|nr:hypothetical protein [Pedosphaera sp.]
MNKLRPHSPKLLVIAVCIFSTSSLMIHAHPYASALTNTSGTVSFRLNEAADNVKVVGNAGTLTNDLGALARGLTVTNLNLSSGMTGGVFSVIAQKAGNGTPTLISDNANVNNQFFGPRGVAVNKRPGSANFGRVYVGNNPGNTGSGRATGDGIYVLNADSTDALGQGNTALTGGLDMVVGSSSMPWRMRVGQDDDMLYICNFTDTTGNLFRVDPDVSATSGTNMFQLFPGGYVGTGAGLPVGYVHGSLSEVYVTGSLATSDLTVYTTDEDYETTAGALAELNSLWRYDIGSASGGASFPWSNAPNAKLATPSIAFVGQTMGLDRGTNGYFYLLDSRSTGGQNVLQVIDPTGPTVLYTSTADSAALGFPFDILSNTVSVAVSPDMNFLACQRIAGQVVLIPLVSGIPNLAGRSEFVALGNNSRQLVFDAADNLYCIGSSTERLRVYSLGLTTTATTTSDGTFSLTTPATSVSVTADTNTIYEAGATVAVLTVVRTNDPLTTALTVAFTMAGTATRGTDYVLQTNGVTFTNNSIIMPVGSGTNNISVVAVDDSTKELTETAIFNLAGTAFYSASPPTSATVAIVDDEAVPAADVTVVQGTMFEANTNDFCRFRITRRGDTNAASFTVNLAYSGSAISGVDFTPTNTVTIDPGVVSVDVNVFPIDDLTLETNETFVVAVAAGAGYTIGTNSPSVTATIIEDEVPAATVLFSDNLNGDSSTNWIVRFAAGNGLDDYRINEVANTFPTTAWDYSTDTPPIPAAPHGTDTLGLKVTVNKDDGALLGGAGINLYPILTNYSPTLTGFSNNFALRFDMYAIINSGSGTTEYSMFGINHSGDKTNWFRSSGDGIGAGGSVDGLFFQVGSDGAALGDYVLNTVPVIGSPIYNPTLPASRAASTLTGIFKAPPWGLSGAPANLQTTTTPSWAQVEVDQVGNVITLKINNTNILSYTNNGAFKSGNLMLGYCDAFDSNTGVGAAVIFDNVRVVDLGRPIITSTTHSGTTTVVNFTWTLDDPTTAFKLQKATTVNGAYADTAATIIKVSAGVYQATLTGESGAAAFYRIRR